MIIDKSYYDYDYENKPQIIDAEKISDDEAKDLFASFGIGTNNSNTL